MSMNSCFKCGDIYDTDFQMECDRDKNMVCDSCAEKLCPTHNCFGCYCDDRPEFFKSEEKVLAEFLYNYQVGGEPLNSLINTDKLAKDILKLP